MMNIITPMSKGMPIASDILIILFFFSLAISARIYSKSGSFFSIILALSMSCFVFSCQAEAILLSEGEGLAGAVEFATLIQRQYNVKSHATFEMIRKCT